MAMKEIGKEKGPDRDRLAGKTFVLTGGLEKYTRSDAKKLIERMGGKVTSSVSRQTDFILTGKDPGSKLAKGRSLGVKIIDEQEFERMTGE